MAADKQDWVRSCTLANEHVRLEPLRPAHAAALARAAASPDTFRYFSRAPRELSPAGMGEFIEFLLGPAATVPFCVVRPGGTPAGISTYLDIRPLDRALEIGWTWYAPDCRSTRINPACKLLLLAHAFEALGCIRVCLKTDERNAHSRGAIEKLGARFEGILRHTMIMPDGFRRSSAYYSILEAEWPAVRSSLERRLEGPP